MRIALEFGNLSRKFYECVAVAALGLLIGAAATGGAFSQVNPQVGKTSRVVNLVIGDNLNTLRQLTVNDPVFALERISAELKSHGEIELNDNSRIVVGPGAEISLDDFVVTGGGIKSGTLNVLKGALRFVSGNSPEGTFTIKTPLATIGIRGTLFDVYVWENGQTDVILFSGSVNVCTNGNQCQIVTRRCDIVRVAQNDRIGFGKFLKSGNSARELHDYSLIGNQRRFQKGWRAPISTCSQRAARANIFDRGPGEDDGFTEPDPKAPDRGPSITSPP